MFAYEIESHTGEVYSIQHYVIKFASDMEQVGGFLRAIGYSGQEWISSNYECTFWKEFNFENTKGLIRSRKLEDDHLAFRGKNGWYFETWLQYFFQETIQYIESSDWSIFE
jgi:hypothetical protein